MRARVVATVTALLLAAGCGSDGTITVTDPGATDLTVFAAASLTEAFTELGEMYERDRPGADVTFSFAGSQVLAAQIMQGAPADVIATADEQTMASLTDEIDGEPTPFARNQLVIITEPGNPQGITSLADLGRRDLAVVLGGPTVPVGKASRQALADAGVVVTPISEEPDVKPVLAKVRLGEADAGIVYRTDALAAGDAVTVVRPAELVVSVLYPIALVADGPHRPAAESFIALVTSQRGQAVLRRAGFGPVTSGL